MELAFFLLLQLFDDYFLRFSIFSLTGKGNLILLS